MVLVIKYFIVVVSRTTCKNRISAIIDYLNLALPIFGKSGVGQLTPMSPDSEGPELQLLDLILTIPCQMQFLSI